MKCRMCSQEAFIKLPRHNLNLCREDFMIFIKRQVRRAIYETEMLGRDENILVAVSGGKDSLVCWWLLSNSGHATKGVHIDLGLGKFSYTSREKVEKFAQGRKLDYEILKIEDLTGKSLEEIARGKRICSVCGLVKRYWLNRYAYEKGFSAIATGHNLNDESAALLGNLLHWQVGYLARQYPLLFSTHPRLVKKVKPLYRLDENEITIFAELNNIDYTKETCPLRKGATNPLYKQVMNSIENFSPGTKSNFLFQFLKRYRDIFSFVQREISLRECVICGMPTTEEVCAYCKLIREPVFEK